MINSFFSKLSRVRFAQFGRDQASHDKHTDENLSAWGQLSRAH